MPIKLFVLLFFSTFLPFQIQAQTLVNENPATSNGQSKEFRPASPNAASLGQYGQVPVGLYTGTIVVDVPLYELTYKNYKLPIGLSYHGSGNRPDIFPGSVGLGWSLRAGGVITRVIKGLPDYEKYVGFPRPTPVKYNPTGPADWSSTASLNELLKGYYTDNDKSNTDEYYFDFAGISGKFYLDHDSTWQIKSTDHQYFKIETEFLPESPVTKLKVQTLPQREDVPFVIYYKDTISKVTMPYKFTVTDGNGMKYIFGGSASSIEFSRPGNSYSAYSVTTIHAMITPMAWCLTSIEFPSGEKITFQYKQHTFVTKVPINIVERSVWNRTTAPSPYLRSTAMLLSQKSTLINGCYLESITTPKETIRFTHSVAKDQLQFPKDPNLHGLSVVNENEFIHYEDVSRAGTEDLYPLKLDTISVRDRADKLFRRVALDYTNSDTTRLKLLGVSIMGSNYITPQRYQFEYNPLPLPPYLSNKTDHYGFYNGRNTYITTTDATVFLNINKALFNQSKDADSAYLQAEMLKKIIYPTGGNTQFEYEPHDYIAYVTTWPFTVITNPSNTNKLTGGLRIKKVTGYDGTGVKSLEKAYYYKRNFSANGTSSSGILAYTPVYFDSVGGPVTPPARNNSPTYYNGNMTFYRWSSNPIYPMSQTRGNHVTYSEVAEVNADGGFTVYKYKNYDNGYNDKPPLNYVSDNTAIMEFWKEDEGISMDLERGQQISEEIYDAAKVIKGKKILKYNDDPSRFDKNIRVLIQTANSIALSDIPSHRVVASHVYKYFPYLKEQVSYLYGNNNDSIVSTLTYTYDTTYRLLKTTETTTSDGRIIKMLYRYPADMVAAGVTVPYATMVSRKMVNFQIERERQENSIIMEKDIVEYAQGLSLNTSLIFPKNIRTQHKSLPIETRQALHLYDSTDNVLMSSVPKGTKTCYVWSYSKTHPVAIIENIDYSVVETVLGGRSAINLFSNKTPTNQEVLNFLLPLRTSPLMSAAFVNTYTYDPLVGVTMMADANNKKMYYEYDNFGRLSIVRDNDSLILKTICYNYAGFIEDCSKGRIDYYPTTVYRATTASEICTGTILNTLDAYAPRAEYFGAGGLPVLVPKKEFYSDKNLANPLPTGFYKSVSGSDPIPANFYWYMVEGKYLYRNLCGATAPNMLKYADTLTLDLCTATLPTVPVFGTIAQGNTLFSDYVQLGIGPKIKDGYYVYNSNYFKATNGVAGPMIPCSNLSNINSRIMSRHSASSGVCTMNKIHTVYYLGSFFRVGTDLFSDINLTIPAPQGYYSNGTNVYTVSSAGTITAVNFCL